MSVFGGIRRYRESPEYIVFYWIDPRRYRATIYKYNQKIDWADSRTPLVTMWSKDGVRLQDRVMAWMMKYHNEVTHDMG